MRLWGLEGWVFGENLVVYLSFLPSFLPPPFNVSPISHSPSLPSFPFPPQSVNPRCDKFRVDFINILPPTLSFPTLLGEALLEKELCVVIGGGTGV